MTKTQKYAGTFFGCLLAGSVAGQGFGTDPWWEATAAVVVAVSVTALISHLAMNPFVRTDDTGN